MRSFRIARAVCAAAALSVPALTTAVVIGGSGTAGATTPPPPAKGTIKCNLIAGKVTFNPPLTLNGTASDTKEVATVAAKEKKCTATPPPTPVSGKVHTTITTLKPSGKANACAGLLTSRAVTLNVHWVMPTGVAPIANSKVHFSGYKIGTNSAGDEGFILPQPGGTASVKGSYPGTNGGATTHAKAYTNETATQLAASCGSPTGLASVTIASGQSVQQ